MSQRNQTHQTNDNDLIDPFVVIRETKAAEEYFKPQPVTCPECGSAHTFLQGSRNQSFSGGEYYENEDLYRLCEDCGYAW